MRKSALSTFPIVVAGVCMAVLVFTAEAIKITHPKYVDAASGSNVVPGHYIISFPLKDSKATSSFTSSFKKEHKGDVKETISHDFFNAVSVAIDTDDEQLHAASVETILNKQDVLAVYPVKKYNRPSAKLVSVSKAANQPSLLPHVQTQVAAVHDKLKNKGKGIFVGVLDTGKKE